MKVCIKCKEEKLETLFHNMKTSSDGLQARCKDCVKEINRVWRLKNPEKAKELCREWYYENAEKVKAASRAWKLRNRERHNANSRKRHATKKLAEQTQQPNGENK